MFAGDTTDVKTVDVIEKSVTIVVIAEIGAALGLSDEVGFGGVYDVGHTMKPTKVALFKRLTQIRPALPHAIVTISRRSCGHACEGAWLSEQLDIVERAVAVVVNVLAAGQTGFQRGSGRHTNQVVILTLVRPQRADARIAAGTLGGRHELADVVVLVVAVIVFEHVGASLGNGSNLSRALGLEHAVNTGGCPGGTLAASNRFIVETQRVTRHRHVVVGIVVGFIGVIVAVIVEAIAFFGDRGGSDTVQSVGRAIIEHLVTNPNTLGAKAERARYGARVSAFGVVLIGAVIAVVVEGITELVGGLDITVAPKHRLASRLGTHRIAEQTHADLFVLFLTRTATLGLWVL